MKHWALPILMILTWSCHSPSNKDHVHDHISAPPSYFGLSVNLSENALRDGLNEQLPAVILDDVIGLKGKDSIDLKIERKGDIALEVDQNEIIASVPIRVSVVLKKSLLGLTISNTVAPVVIDGILRFSARVSLLDDWQMNFECKYHSFDIVGQANVQLWKLKINLNELVDKQLEKNRESIQLMMGKSMTQAVNFQSIVNQIWIDLQNPKKIAENPLTMWLHSDPVGLSGEIIPAPDALMVHLEYRTVINIATAERVISNPVSLGQKGNNLTQKNVLAAYPDLQLSYDKIGQTLKKILAAQQFEYKGYKINVMDVKVSRDRGKLKFKIGISGDLDGEVLAWGVPALNDNHELIIEDFKYEIAAGDDWMKLADWAVHQLAQEYVTQQVRLDTKPFFNNLDKVITQSLLQSDLGRIMELDLSFSNLTSYQIGLAEDDLHWIFFVDGSASINLKKEVFY